MKFGHGSLYCPRALSRVIKVSCRFIIFIYKETLPVFARSGYSTHKKAFTNERYKNDTEFSKELCVESERAKRHAKDNVEYAR